ncbi:hypothetical protein [Pseudoalteromonas ulvae]|uniref:Uncharacterized protein n=1 Tax=Pseudoalteromonas ulvae TaxID=107327 RepID=A0A244CUK4_PSEDV|nr:hypothetical protein [Pseudoalteromonas ulvae]OUL59264.1 hypothetical protein B1199_03065 [Pseudoalteromonas ulvae]
MADINVLGTRLLELKQQNETALRSAVANTASFAHTQFTNAIYQRYNFKQRDYVAERLNTGISLNNIELTISARQRLTNAIEFANSPLYRQGKQGQQVLAGYSGAYLRAKSATWRGAFSFIGKNGNLLMAYRKKGETWRDIPNQLPYGPSVAGAFGVIKDDTAPAIVDHLVKLYQQAL